MCCYKNKGLGLLILRVFIGSIFLVHGIQKFLNIVPTTEFFTQIGLNSFWVWVVAFTETIGGALLILGLFTQYASLLLSIVIVVAVTLVKYKYAGPTALDKFAAAEVDLALLGGLLALMFSGSGRYSLSRWCKCHKTGADCKVCDVMGCENGKCGDQSKCEGGTCEVK